MGGKPMASWRGLGFPGPVCGIKAYWGTGAKSLLRKYDPIKKEGGAAGDVVAGRYSIGARQRQAHRSEPLLSSPALSVTPLKEPFLLGEGDFHHFYESPLSMQSQEWGICCPRKSLGSSQQMKGNFGNEILDSDRILFWNYISLLKPSSKHWNRGIACHQY